MTYDWIYSAYFNNIYWLNLVQINLYITKNVKINNFKQNSN